MPTRLLARTLLLLAALSSGSALAQFSEVVTVTPNVLVPDDGYDGTLASMACADLLFSEQGRIQDIRLDLGVDQTWIGDLTVKVASPSGEVLTVLSRPGFAEGIDDGSGCCGDSSDMSADFPVGFGDLFTDPAETMGNTILGTAVVCRDDGRCTYFPNPDSGPGTSFAQYFGQAAAGVWQVCVGDAAAGDPATFVTATLTIFNDGEPPNCGLTFSATLDDDTPAPGQVITFTVTVTNVASNSAPVDLWLVAIGPVNRTLRLGSGTLPGGATVTRNVRLRVPGNAPQGTYDVDLNLGTFPDDVCQIEAFTINVGSAPRLVAPNEVKAEVADRVGVAVRPQPDVTFEVLDDFFATDAEAAAVGVRPNPLVSQATISFEVAEAAPARLAVYDVLGRQVAVLVDGQVEAGLHTATFDARGLSAGTYVYRLQVGGAVQTGRMTLAR